MKIIRYNWENIKNKLGNVQDILEYFKEALLLENTDFLVLNKKAKDIYYSKDRKDSFISDNGLKALLISKSSYTEDEIYIYLDLISKRDIFSFYNSKGRENFLHCWKIENIYNIENLKRNKLLMIENNKIFFIYEGD